MKAWQQSDSPAAGLRIGLPIFGAPLEFEGSAAQVDARCCVSTGGQQHIGAAHILVHYALLV